MNRLEAQHAMLLGKRVGNNHFNKEDKVEYFFDGKYFKLSTNSGITHANMNYATGYYIIEDKPKFKKVTMYRPVVTFNSHGKARVSNYIYKTTEQALAYKEAIGYEEVEVMVKDE